MKIKTDFITNSSSCCFIVESPHILTKNYIHDKGFRGTFNEFGSFGTIEELIEHTDCEPCDWVKKITGPRKFWGASKEKYERSKKIIEEGHCVSFIDVERDPDDVESFERIMSQMDGRVIIKEREYD